MKYRIFLILYWLMRHYIPHLIMAGILIATCLSSCASHRVVNNEDARIVEVHDTITLHHYSDLSSYSMATESYEHEILSLQARLDSASGVVVHDTIRIERERWHKRDTAYVNCTDTIFVYTSTDSAEGSFHNQTTEKTSHATIFDWICVIVIGLVTFSAIFFMEKRL